jgi:hypothetical protein
MIWRSFSTTHSSCHDFLPHHGSRNMEPSDLGLNTLISWVKTNLSSCMLFSLVFWSQLCKSNWYNNTTDWGSFNKTSFFTILEAGSPRSKC